MSGRSSVAFHCHFLDDSNTAGWIPRKFPAQPDFPLWIKVRRAFGAHPRGKSFIEPKIVPPSHRYQVAEPLVRHFVCENLVDILLCFRRGTFRIKQKFRFVVGNATPVFHRASEAAGHRDLIQFRQGIGHSEICVVVLQDLRSGFERVAPRLSLAFCRNHSELGRAGSRFNEIEFACNENIQVTGHRRRRGEAHLFAASDFFLALNWHVRDSEPVFRHDRGQLEARAKDWLVPAGKKSTGIGRFKLASQHGLPSATALLLIPHVEKALPSLIYFTRETKPKVCSPVTSSDGNASASSSFFSSISIAEAGNSLPSIDAASILRSSAFNTNWRTRLRTSSFTVSVPANVNLSISGMIRPE